MIDIVELIDIMNNEHFGYIKPAPRTPRLRRRCSPSINVSETMDRVSTISSPENDLMSTNMFASELLHVNNNDKQGTATRGTLLRDSDSRRTSRCSEINKFVISSGEKKAVSKQHKKNVIQDEGYGTMSPQTSPIVSPLEKAYVEQRNGFVLFCRPTKAFLSRKRETDQSITRKQKLSIGFSRNNSKVNTVGSYSWESKVWYGEISEKSRTQNPKSNQCCRNNGTGPHMFEVNTPKHGIYGNMFYKERNNCLRHNQTGTTVQRHLPTGSDQETNYKRNILPLSANGLRRQPCTNSYRSTCLPTTVFGQNGRRFSSPFIRPKSTGHFSDNFGDILRKTRPKTSITSHLHTNWKK